MESSAHRLASVHVALPRRSFAVTQVECCLTMRLRFWLRFFSNKSTWLFRKVQRIREWRFYMRSAARVLFSLSFSIQILLEWDNGGSKVRYFSRGLCMEKLMEAHFSFRYRRFPACVRLAAESQQRSAVERPCTSGTRSSDRAIVRGHSSSVAWRISTHISAVDDANYFATRQM